MGKIIPFTGVVGVNINLDAPTMLRNIAEEGAEHAVVFIIKDGEISFHSSTGDVYKLLYYAESFKDYLMSGGFDNE